MGEIHDLIAKSRRLQRQGLFFVCTFLIGVMPIILPLYPPAHTHKYIDIYISDTLVAQLIAQCAANLCLRFQFVGSFIFIRLLALSSSSIVVETGSEGKSMN